MFSNRIPMRPKATPRSQDLKDAIVACFTMEGADARGALSSFNEADWLSVMWWLDISGMAIYFLDRARQTGVDAILPRDLEANLAQRLNRNRIRMEALLRESRTLAAWFEGVGVPYVLLKGFTLWPDSVPDPALRCQTDLDFLVEGRRAKLAIHFINRLGYRLYAKSGNTLEYRAGAPNIPDMNNLYSAHTQRALELHLVPENAQESRLLMRRNHREFEGMRICSLSPADILVQQALHLLKHLCGEHTRLSWVLEFRRHVAARSNDRDFWRRAEFCAAESANGDLAMGTALWVAEELFGKTGLDLPSQWSTDALPGRVKLWLERYVRRLLLSDTTGNKLYALLRKEVPCAPQEARRTRDILLPRVLPRPILEARPNETLADRWTRYGIELDYFLLRLKFHFQESLRYAIESSRWSRAAARVGR
jgi:Uncharacterised nucleotidyltransferase